LLADITWTGWSDFRELRIVRTNAHPRANNPWFLKALFVHWGTRSPLIMMEPE
jgi:hypothetical protein